MNGPRNLASPVVDMLRKLGFEVWEQPHASPSIALVTGWWRGGRGEQFVFQYAHNHPPGPADALWWGGCSLGCQATPTAPVRDCFTTTQVRRLREVRLLLLGNEQFAQARAAALLAQVRQPATPTSPQP